MSGTQEFLDKFYFAHGPCCAGCDWWRSINSLIGECRRTKPVGGTERASLIGIENCSAKIPSGHIVTERSHHCGDFKDEFDWQSLPLPYRKRVGALSPSPFQPERTLK